MSQPSSPRIENRSARAEAELHHRRQRMSLRQRDKRFGVIALEEKFITVDQLVEAIRVQVKEEVEEGRHRLIGNILFDQGILIMDQINQVLKIIEASKE